ncbi:hypothetical protein ACFL6R_00735 [Gemmatimonadota bacterium]
MYRFHKWLLLALLTGPAVGCSNSADLPYLERMDGGIRVLEYTSAIPPLNNPYVPGDPVTYGENQREDTFLLNGAEFIDRLESGVVLVNDFRDGKIHRFASDGEWLGSFGQKGPGPHEFGLGYLPYLYNNQIFAWVGSSQRLLQFDALGEYLGGRRSEFLTGAPPVPLTSDPQDGFFAYHRRVMSPQSTSTTATSYFTLFRVHQDLVQADTLYHYEREIEGFYTGTMYSYQPYQPLVQPFAFSTDLPFAFGRTEHYRIELIPVDGVDTLAIELPVNSPSIPAEEKQRSIERYSRYGWEEEARRHIRFPGRLPAIRWLIWDAEDRLWVEDYQPVSVHEDGRHYNIFTSEGVWIASQDLPVRPEAIFSDGYYMNTENEAGEPVVVFVPMEWNPGR